MSMLYCSSHVYIRFPFCLINHSNLSLRLFPSAHLIAQIHDFHYIGLTETYIHLLLWPQLLLNIPPCPCLLEEVLKVIAADSDTVLGALAHVVDGLPYLRQTHPLG